MTELDRRLNGWKAIAAFFGRDRTTVTRWAKERGLPVHYIPGGKQKSVFAIEHELEAWRLRFDAGEQAEVDTPIAPPRPLRRRWPLWGVAAAVAVVALPASAIVWTYSSATSAGAPDTSKAMTDYIAARDAWARRTPEDIRDSIRRFEKIIGEAPDFAPARAGLAEAWLIYREYGDVSDAKAYGAARIAAQKALALDPDLAMAHRAMGFIDYWWDNDPARAVSEFTRAIEIDENDAQTHFWFANVLADLGEDQAAEQHYSRARLLAPGSQAIAVEHACAQWQAGRDDLALKMMTQLRQRYPGDATISNCLAWVHIGQGDIRGFAREYAVMAKLRGETELIRLSQAVDAAIARDPATAHQVLIADARRELAMGTRRIREVPAFYASAMGDRVELLALMHEAQTLGEHWYSPSITSRIAARWKGDAEILGLLARLRVKPRQFEGL